MRVLFVHEAFPAQYRHLVGDLASDGRHQVVFASAADGQMPGVETRVYKAPRATSPDIHHYLRWGEQSVLTGQAVYRCCRSLKAEGFTPDVVCAHLGWGPGLYLKDVFPNCRLVGYCEWYYHARDSDADYLEPMAEDDALRLRTRNSTLLLEIAQCDRMVTPTRFQRDQFPAMVRNGLTVLHDGIDTDYFAPGPAPPLVPGAEQVVTYATRGMEPYRGFPQFMRALERLQRRHPGLHAVIAGEDAVFYGQHLPPGQTWRQRMLEELPGLDHQRLHFTGPLSLDAYRRLLLGSDVHVYLTVPFVLSWSLLEAMACGCLIVGSDTAPVREVITDGQQGLLADFTDPAALADRIEEALAMGKGGLALRAAARRKVVGEYALSDLLPRQMALLGC